MNCIFMYKAEWMIKYVSLPCITQKYLKIIIPVYQSTANPLYVSQY